MTDFNTLVIPLTFIAAAALTVAINMAVCRARKPAMTIITRRHGAPRDDQRSDSGLERSTAMGARTRCSISLRSGSSGPAHKHG